jgi:hypothetical protein
VKDTHIDEKIFDDARILSFVRALGSAYGSHGGVGIFDHLGIPP